MKASAVVLAALCALCLASVAIADTPPEGTNCHRSCYTLDLKYALPLKKELWAKCGFDEVVVVQKTSRGDPGSSDKGADNAFGCGALIQYKFPSWKQLVAYQDCEHSSPTYKAKLEKYKISLPASVLRDFKC